MTARMTVETGAMRLDVVSSAFTIAFPFLELI